MLRPATRLASDEGSVLVIVAIALTSLILVAAFVVDVANFYSHKRHLQLQADAAALAGAHNLTAGGCSNSLIDSGARKYGGSDSPDGTLIRTQSYNDQLGGTPARKVHILVNSKTYWNGADTSWNSGAPSADGSPCDKGYVDIKATESNLPWFFGFGGFVQSINAHARVALVQESTSNGALPIAVPNPLPTSAAAIFFNEGTGAVLATQAFTHIPCTPPGPCPTLDMWQTSPVSVLIQGPATGVVIALSGKPSVSLAGSLTTICGQQLTDCYDATSDPPSKGLSFIRGYSTSGSGSEPNPPILRSVGLFGAGCSPYFSNGTCTYDFVARIDAGTVVPEANQIYGVNGQQLTASSDPNCAQIAGADKCWHQNITLPSNTGAVNLPISWKLTAGCRLASGCTHQNDFCDTQGNSPSQCNGNFGVAQRAYSAKDTSSGPIKLVNLFNCDDPSCATPDGHSYPTGGTHSFMVVIGIGGTLRNATDQNDPLVSLRIELTSGGVTHSLDCDPGYSNLKTELASGCRPSYVPWTIASPDCSGISRTTLWNNTPQPWNCVAVDHGTASNDVPAGLNLRVLLDDKASVCPALGQNGHNNWSMFDPNYVPTPGDTRGQDGFPIGDRRILNAFLTSYGAFSHVSGGGSVPITGFGHFYVTGWTGQGQGFNNPCQGAPPLGGDDPVPGNDKALIVGHFIRYIDTLGGDGSLPCDPNSINACVIVMTN